MQSSDPLLMEQQIRKDFPSLDLQVHGRPLVYLDNAASTFKPMPVLDAERSFYIEKYANVHRGVHYLSQEATRCYEEARAKVASFLGAASPDNIVFTKGCTEAINLVAQSWGRRLEPGDEVLVTAMEHHANLVPWQMICAQQGAILRIVPIDERGQTDLEALESMLNPRSKMLAFCSISNVLGTHNPVETMIRMAKAVGCTVLVDAAQAVAHGPIRVAELDVDFLCFSGHKMYGPTGIGILYGRRELLHSMPPWQGGGDMIREVDYQITSYAEPPLRFEAGTPPIAQAIGLGAAIDYLQSWGWEIIMNREKALYQHLQEVLDSIPDLRKIGEATDRSSAQSFLLGQAHPYDVGLLLDSMGIAVRTGHHCAQPLMKHWNLPGTVRASVCFYNTLQELDTLGQSLLKTQRMLGHG